MPLLQPRFDEHPGEYKEGPGSFSEGLARVPVERSWGFIDKTGSIVIQPQFDYAGSFSEGRALVRLGGTWQEGGPSPGWRDGKYGFIDKRGDVVIEPQFHTAWDFCGGLARVQFALHPSHPAYLDKTGKHVWDSSVLLQCDRCKAILKISDDKAAARGECPVCGAAAGADEHYTLYYRFGE